MEDWQETRGTEKDISTVMELLREVEDPEVPVNIVDLGLVVRCNWGADGCLEIDLVPTRWSCPAREYFEQQIVRRLRERLGIAGVRVQWAREGWSVDRLSEAGRAVLREYGVAVPGKDPGTGREVVRCPYCGSDQVRRDTRFGKSLCRAIWYCSGCRNPFEVMKWAEREGAEV